LNHEIEIRRDIKGIMVSFLAFFIIVVALSIFSPVFLTVKQYNQRNSTDIDLWHHGSWNDLCHSHGWD